jgi:hypothetical protein
LLDPTCNRDEVTLRTIVEAPYVRGSVLVLGKSDFALDAFLRHPEVREVTYVPGEGRVTLPKHYKLRPVLDVSPFHVQRRMIGRDAVDLVFCDMSRDPFDRKRTETMKGRAHEFRCSQIAYRWQEIDIVAEWLGAGFAAETIDSRAFPLFAMRTGLMIEPATNEYAKRCAEIATLAMNRVV